VNVAVHGKLKVFHFFNDGKLETKVYGSGILNLPLFEKAGS